MLVKWLPGVPQNDEYRLGVRGGRRNNATCGLGFERASKQSPGLGDLQPNDVPSRTLRQSGTMELASEQPQPTIYMSRFAVPRLIIRYSGMEEMHMHKSTNYMFFL